MTAAKVLAILATLLGVAGSVFLYKGSVAYEPPGSYGSAKLIQALTDRNRARQRLQHLGISLLGGSFALQFLAILAS